MQGEDLYGGYNQFWQVAVGSAGPPDMSDVEIPVESPRVRRFGSIGHAPTFSRKERSDREAQARLEREALSEMVSEVVVAMTAQSPPYFQLSQEEMQRHLQKTAAHAEHTKAIEHPVGYSCNIAQRSLKDATCSSGPAFMYACRSWRGRVVSKDELQNCDPLLSAGAKLNPFGSGYLVGTPGTMGWPYRPDEYPWGEGWDIDDDLETLEAVVNLARNWNLRAMNILRDHATFKQRIDGQLFQFRASGPEEIRSKLIDELDHRGAAFPDQVEDLRSYLLKRYEESMKAKRVALQITSKCQRAIDLRKNETEDGSSLLLSVVTTVDFLKPIIDDMNPTDASRLLMVFQCARVEDAQMYTELRKRLPRLHIYTVRDMLPHARRANGLGVIYRDKQIQIPLALVTSRMRSRIRYDNPHINPVGVAEMIEEQHYMTARDPAMRTREDEIILLDGDRTHRDAVTRRIKNNGWNEVKYDLDPDNQLTLVPHATYFRDAPTVNVRLVHAESFEPVVPNDPHGGLEPERWLRAAGGVMRYESKTANSGYRSNRDPWFVPLNLQDKRNGGIMGRYYARCLTSEHEGRRFCIQITMTGPSKRDPRNMLTLKTETAPMVFLSNKRATENAPKKLSKRAKEGA